MREKGLPYSKDDPGDFFVKEEMDSDSDDEDDDEYAQKTKKIRAN